MNRRKKRFCLLILGLTGLAALFRLFRLDAALEYDEIWTLENYASASLKVIFTELALPNNHPLNSLAVKLTAFSGGAPQWIRLVPFLAGVLAVPLAGAAAFGLWKRRSAALWSMFFVAVLHMTVEGVAIATVVSNAVSAAILYSRLRRHGGDIHIEPRKLCIDRRVLVQTLRIGVPAGVQSAMFSVSNIVIQAAVNTLGTTVMAASSAAFNVEIFAYYVMNGFTQACTTFVGQNYGAGQAARCKKTLKLSLLEAAAALGATILLALLSGHFLLSLFNRDPEVVAIGYTRLVYIFVAYPFTMIYEMLSGYLRGFGHSLVPAVLTVLGICGVRIAWILIAFPGSPTFETILTAYPISLFATALFLTVALVIYRPASRLEKAAKAAKN